MTTENIVDKFRITKRPDAALISYTVSILKDGLLRHNLFDSMPPFREKDGLCDYEFYNQSEADAFYNYVVKYETIVAFKRYI